MAYLGGMAIVVLPHDPSWLERGAQLCAMLREELGPLALRVEHIGSTSIPGMAAKPVFDLQLSVSDLDEAASAFDLPLELLGLIRRPFEHDHIPAGYPDDPAGWRKRLWSKANPEGERINLHCRVAGAPNEQLALMFRDWFRAHPGAVPAYSEFKIRLAAQVQDIGAYSDIKDPVVDLIIAVASGHAG